MNSTDGLVPPPDEGLLVDLLSSPRVGGEFSVSEVADPVGVGVFSRFKLHAIPKYNHQLYYTFTIYNIQNCEETIS